MKELADGYEDWVEMAFCKSEDLVYDHIEKDVTFLEGCPEINRERAEKMTLECDKYRIEIFKDILGRYKGDVIER